MLLDGAGRTILCYTGLWSPDPESHRTKSWWLLGMVVVLGLVSVTYFGLVSSGVQSFGLNLTPELVVNAGQSFIWSAFLSMALVATVHNNGREGNRRLVGSILEHDQLGPLLDRYVGVGFGLGVVGLSALTAATVVTLVEGKGRFWFLAVHVVASIPLNQMAVVTSLTYLAVCHATANVVNGRAGWAESELEAALRTRQLNDTVALRVVRVYGSLIVTIEMVSNAVGPVLVGYVALFIGTFLVNFVILAKEIISDESSGPQSNYGYLYVPFSAAMLLFILVLPARVSAAMELASKRLRFVCSGALDLDADGKLNSASADGGASDYGGAGRGVAFELGLSGSSSSSSSSGDTASSSSSSGGGGGGGGGKNRSGNHHRSTAKTTGNGVYVDDNDFVETIKPFTPIPLIATGGNSSVFRMVGAAVHPPVGRAATAELNTIGNIAVHLRDESPAIEIAGVRITNSLVARITYSVVSVAVVVIRFASSSEDTF